MFWPTFVPQRRTAPLFERMSGLVKNKHLRLSIAIALVALSLSLLILSISGKRTESSSLQKTANPTLRIESIAPGARP